MPAGEIRRSGGTVLDEETIIDLGAEAGDGGIGAACPEGAGIAVAIAEDDEFVVGKVLSRDQTVEHVDLSVGFEPGADNGIFVRSSWLEGSGAEEQIAVLANGFERVNDFLVIQLVESGVDLDPIASSLLKKV